MSFKAKPEIEDDDDSTMEFESLAAISDYSSVMMDPERRRTTFKRLTNIVDISPEQAEELTNMTNSERKAEVKRLEGLLGQYKLLMFLIGANVGWYNYTANMATFYCKKVLELSAAESAQLFSFALLPWSMKPLWGFFLDSFCPFGYRLKSHCAIMAILNAVVVSVLIFIPKPSLMVLSWVMFLQTVTVSYLDSMAQGMTAMITKMTEKVIALKDPDEADKSHLKIFGLYTSFKSLIRTILTFAGGFVVQRTLSTHLMLSGIILAAFPALLAVLTILLIKEEKEPVFFKGCGGYLEGLKKSVLSVLNFKALGPFCILVFFQFLPQMSQVYTFILLSIGG